MQRKIHRMCRGARRLAQAFLPVPLALCAAASLAWAQTPLFSDDIHRLLPAYPALYGDFADVDADGDLDVVLGDRVLLNDGNGVFRDGPVALPERYDIRCVAFGDLDQDGDLDLVVGHNGPEEVWLNDGSGCFVVAPHRLPASPGVQITDAIALGDVDGDRDLDIVVANHTFWDCEEWCQPGVQCLFLNDGHAVFTDASAQIQQAAAEFTAAAELGDVDGDGDLDLVLGNVSMPDLDGPHRLLLNDGAGVFTDAPGQIPYGIGSFEFLPSLTIADFDGDNDLDILFGSRELWINDGTGFFTDASSNIPLHAPHGRAAVGDVDGDGDLDVLPCRVGDDDRLLLNDGTAVFTIGGKLPASIELSRQTALADVDADGDLDALLVHGSQTELALNAGNGAYCAVPPLWPSQPENTWAVAVGDVDGDGSPDVLAALGDGPDQGQDKLLLNDGSGALVDATHQFPVAMDDSQDVALVDVDGDGDLDALIANGAGYLGELDQLYLNDGLGSFTRAPGMWVNSLDETRAMAVSDVDSDGDVDVLTCNVFGAPNRLYFNDGSGYLVEVLGKWPASSVNAFSVAFGDLDGDGDPDAVLGEDGATLYLNDGAGGFTEIPGALFVSNLATGEIAIGDVDRDGDRDVVTCANFATANQSTLRLFVNDGTAGFVEDPARVPFTQDYISASAMEDFDADGDLDLVLCALPDSRLLLNDGQGYFADAAGPGPNLGHSYGMAAADVDGDGDLDLACGQHGGHARLLINLTRQLAWRTPPRIGRELAFDVWGAPNAAFSVYGSCGRTWLPFGGQGVLRIVRKEIFYVSGGVLDSRGRGTASYRVPEDPALIGASYYWQALLFRPRRLSNLEITTFVDL